MSTDKDEPMAQPLANVAEHIGNTPVAPAHGIAAKIVQAQGIIHALQAYLPKGRPSGTAARAHALLGEALQALSETEGK